MGKKSLQTLIMIQILTSEKTSIWPKTLGFRHHGAEALVYLGKKGYITCHPSRGYQITPEGVLAIEEELARPFEEGGAKEWIMHVRMGIDTSGHETKIQRAACPDHLDPQMWVCPDMEGMVDALDRFLDDEIDAYERGEVFAPGVLDD